MNFSRSLNCILFLTTLTLTLFLTFQANAAAPFDTTMCNITNIVTGNAGKAFAAFAVISLGVGFFSGKISLGLLVASSIGISSIFAAPSMVSLLSGKDAYECEEGVTYITDCSVNGVCYSCPAGHVGPNCLCPEGFTGPTCSECNAVGFSLIDGVCKPDCSISPTIPGITDTTVQNGTSSLECNAENYTGSINYSCNNSIFSITGGECTCEGNYSLVDNCESCKDGYEGEEGEGCEECSDNYIEIDGICAAYCDVKNEPGISHLEWAVPPNGTLTCNSLYNITIDYTCNNGVFNGDSCLKCSGGTESIISDGGVSYRLHKFSLVGTSNFSCNGNKDVEVLVVAGGGSGGSSTSSGGGGGGGGGVVYQKSYSITSGIQYSVVVGDGGSSVSGRSSGTNGYNSTFGAITAYGGGGGGGGNNAISRRGLSGGSGGGSGRDQYTQTGGAVISGIGGGIPYGNAGGGGANSGYGGSGGGGGAGGVGNKGYGNNNSTNERGGDGGSGISNSITGVALEYAGGGGGSTQFSSVVGNGRSGGGNGGNNTGKAVTPGMNGTGSGGGGCASSYSGKGGSGIVIVRYVK